VGIFEPGGGSVHPSALPTMGKRARSFQVGVKACISHQRLRVCVSESGKRIDRAALSVQLVWISVGGFTED